MLKEMRVEDVEDLYVDVPESVKLKRELNIPKALSELQVKRLVEDALSKNTSTDEIPSFLGSGCSSHYIPAVVHEVINRSELMTSYTPYQPETSQGLLQALFEYQSMICELTGMDFSNSSLYDWSTTLGEAARMAKRVTGKSEFIIPHFIDPEKFSTLINYAEPAEMKIVHVRQSEETGQIVLEDLEKKLSDRTAGVYFENPNYLGCYELGVEEISEATHKNGGLVVAGVDPISLGILKPPGDYGADIVIGEGQSLGNGMNYGGPLLGIIACRGDRLLRQMPGRMIGMTTSLEGNERAFSMVMQTREQHIRRHRATSNICTNDALCAVAAAVYLSLLGPVGLRKLCEVIITNSHYAMRKLNSINGVKTPLIKAEHFKEFTVSFDDANRKIDDIHKRLLMSGIQGGKIIKHEFPELGETALYCVTEVHSKEEIDKLADELRQILG